MIQYHLNSSRGLLMSIFNFLMDKFEKVTHKSNFILILLAIAIAIPMKFFMKKRYAQYFSDRSALVQKELGPPKYRVNMEVNILTENMVNETFIIKEVYINHADKFYIYDLEDIKDGTAYSLVPEKFLCPLIPHAFAVNNVSFDSMMSSLTLVKKTHHDIAW